MNLNLSKIIKENSFESKDAKSINNWIRVLDTSGMTVVDQLILDNHRRQLLKALQGEDSSHSFFKSMKKSSKNHSKILNSNDTSFQSKIDESSIFDQTWAERLHSDAYYREMKMKKRKEEKEATEFEEALQVANARHPKRKLDPQVFARLTQDERVIKSLYEKDLQSSHRPRRFSALEQKASVDRLYNTRGNSSSRIEDSQTLNRKLQQDELNAMISRLYKVKKPVKNVLQVKNVTRKKRKNVHDLKSSKRYVENPERLSEIAVESFSEVENRQDLQENLGNPFQSPKTSVFEGEALEIKLLSFVQNPSPATTEVNKASPPFGGDLLDDSMQKLSQMETLSPEMLDDSIILVEKNYLKDETYEIKEIIEEIKDKLLNSEDIVNASTEIIITHSPESVVSSHQSSPSNQRPSSDTADDSRNNSSIGQDSLTPNKEYSTISPNSWSITSRLDSLKSLPFPKSIYLEPEDLSSRVQTTYSQESLYLMQNPLHSLPTTCTSPNKATPCVLDSYRFIVGITEDDEFIYAD
jgi:hypothetical protein